jgi:hypothetical protein
MTAFKISEMEQHEKGYRLGKGSNISVINIKEL